LLTLEGYTSFWVRKWSVFSGKFCKLWAAFLSVYIRIRCISFWVL